MGLHDELRHLTGNDKAPVVRVERYEAVVLEPTGPEGRCVCGRRTGQPGSGEGFVAGQNPALGSGGGLMEVWAVLRMIEALAVRIAGRVLAAGARHPRFVLWAAVLWLVAGVVS
jgi:hypothetical protein